MLISLSKVRHGLAGPNARHTKKNRLKAWALAVNF
jgi:hypothetical protein